MRYESSPKLEELKRDLKDKGLATVCQESMCPNVSECWNGGTATFMLHGDTCSRGCAFCHIKTSQNIAPPDPKEAQKVCESVKKLGLHYVVLTTVTRDDMPDQGANHMAYVIKYLKHHIPDIKVEILIPDFQGRKDLLEIIARAKPDVIAHNVETVRRLTPKVRDNRANYDQSLSVLRNIADMDIIAKSSIMVGLGETKEEVEQTMDDLRAAGTGLLTLGQYLRPSKGQLLVKEYVPLETFKYYETAGKGKGFINVKAGPFVRSSYRAGELMRNNNVHE